MKEEKTHWLHNPNKNYLGHQDLPNGDDVVLTIASAGWEAVKNPILNTTQEKRIVRFVEKAEWVKPLICNETNAKTILKVIGEKFMEDSIGKKIKIGISKTKLKRDEVDCLRVRDVKSENLVGDFLISSEQGIEIEELSKKAGKNLKDICAAYKINTIIDLPLSKFETVKQRLLEIIKESENENS